jgi:hypothetical protein
VRDSYDDPRRVAELWAENPEAEDANKDGVPDVEDADPDGDGNPATWVEVNRVPAASIDDLLDSTELPQALGSCKGTVCRVPTANITFSFTFKKSGARLLLDTIERHEVTTGCDTIGP